MEESVDRPNSLRSSAVESVDERVQELEKSFENLRFVNDVVEGVVRDIMNDLDRAEVEDGLEGGVLRCSHITQAGDRIEISAVDFESLASDAVFDGETRTRIEKKMTHLADSSIASLGSDTLESLFCSAHSAEGDEQELLAVHEIDDISFFTVISNDRRAR